MKKILLTVFCLIAVAGLLWFVVLPTSAYPANTSKGTGCYVKDANGVQYFDPACKFHLVTKKNKDGTVQFVRYQDHGTLPEGAARPSSTMRFVQVHNCNGCQLQGTYQETVTPGGQYHSTGPN